MNEIQTGYYRSPIGLLSIEYTLNYLNRVTFVDETSDQEIDLTSDSELLTKTRIQLNEYFSSKRKVFDLPLRFNGTFFQEQVWMQLSQIPYGTNISYLQLANLLGNPKCIRAAASANGKNKFAIIVPCHRVIGSHGNLTGYAWGLDKKQWLLEHEFITQNGFKRLF